MSLPPHLSLPRPSLSSSRGKPWHPVADTTHAACRLVLLVGAALRPDAALLAALARDGPRVL